jgi:hypothetical protein
MKLKQTLLALCLLTASAAMAENPYERYTQ